MIPGQAHKNQIKENAEGRQKGYEWLQSLIDQFRNTLKIFSEVVEYKDDSRW